MPIGDLWDLIADLTNIYELVEEIRAVLATLNWGIVVLLDLFLHAGWAIIAAVAGLWLAYWLARGLYFALGGRRDEWEGLSFTTTKRVVLVCVLAQFLMDVQGHAYAVWRQGLPVTLGNIWQHSARDFHAASWAVALGGCVVVVIYLLVRTALVLRGKPGGLESAMRVFGYTVALFAALSSHMWWDRLLSFG
jgi:hypothetical protein